MLCLERRHQWNVSHALAQCRIGFQSCLSEARTNYRESRIRSFAISIADNYRKGEKGSRLYKRQRKLARQFCRGKERFGAHRLEDFGYALVAIFRCFVCDPLSSLREVVTCAPTRQKIAGMPLGEVVPVGRTGRRPYKTQRRKGVASIQKTKETNPPILLRKRAVWRVSVGGL